MQKKTAFWTESSLDVYFEELIPTRSRQTYSKQVCLGDLAQIICITFIIQMAWAIWFFVAISLPRLLQQIIGIQRWEELQEQAPW